MKNCLLIIVLVLSSFISFSQVQISGPDCVEVASVGKYQLSFRQSRTDSVMIKVTGGHFESGDSVKYLKYPGAVLVVWDSLGINKIEASFGGNSSSVYINTITGLVSGEVLPTERIQYWSYNVLSYVFHCADPIGGACQPTYSFQWQSSTDGITFTNIPGAIGRDLTFSQSITSTIIFRRITKESQSNTSAMSEESRLVKQ